MHVDILVILISVLRNGVYNEFALLPAVSLAFSPLYP